MKLSSNHEYKRLTAVQLFNNSKEKFHVYANRESGRYLTRSIRATLSF